MKRQTDITITGSEGLIGSALCKYFKKKGRSVKKLDIKLGHDLTNERFVKKWFKENPTQNLINCFAIDDKIDSTVKKSDLFNFPLEKFSNYFNVNVLALFSVCREFARNSKNGTIINFSSTYGVVSPNPNLYENSTKDIAYGVTKAAVINLTKYLATHLGPSIRVNCVAPGGVKFKQDSNFIKKYSKHTPMGRMMKKNELNSLIEFLSSENSSYVTGAVMVIDGGWTIW